MLTYYGPVLGQLCTTAIENERHAGQPSPIFLPGASFEKKRDYHTGQRVGRNRTRAAGAQERHSTN